MVDSRLLLPRTDLIPQIQIIFPAGLPLERRWFFADGSFSPYWALATGAVVAVPPAARACLWRHPADREADVIDLQDRIRRAAAEGGFPKLVK